MILALTLFLPLFGFLLIQLSGKSLRKPIGGILASVFTAVPFLLSSILFTKINQGHSIQIKLFDWIATSGLNASFGLQADKLTIIMMMVVTGVSCLIHIYSIGYMREDEGFNRFFAYLNLFVFFMLLLVVSDNYLLLFAGWEGVGLCSYLLIGFWFKNAEYAKAANKAFIMNRIGDLGLMIGIAVLFYTFGSFSFASIDSSLAAKAIPTQTAFLIAMLLFTGAVGKSAQIPLYTWLPDAMAGPTPVSALIHAATMVTAGIYLVIRAELIFLLSPFSMEIVATIGIVTALWSATIALKQNDIKKILAYSTVSQLGLMFFALGLGAFGAGLFHLVTHAFFKALLFLCAGSVIHALQGEQDIRNMGGLKNKIPITYYTMLIGALAIAGIPPLSGFFSKDGILAAALHVNPVLWLLGVIVSIFTAFYIFRLIYLVFYRDYRGSASVMVHIHESPWVMTVPLLFLAFLAFSGGIINIPGLFGGNQWLDKFIGLGATESLNPAKEWIGILITLTFIGAFIYLSYVLYTKKGIIPAREKELKGFTKVLSNKYYIDEIYETALLKPLLWVSEKMYSFFELKVMDALVEGVGKTVITGSRIFRYMQSGSISLYLLLMVAGIICILFFNLFV
jgi:NADH-quinone oxidoreductase subunit L